MMRTLLKSILLSLAVSGTALAAEKPETIRRRIADSEARKAAVIAQSRAHASYSKGGVIHLKDYEALLRVRYSDEDGIYTPGAELADSDREIIRTLVKNYLKEDIPAGRLSVGRAVAILIEARRMLTLLADEQDAPTEANHSELEIIAKRLADDADLLSELSAK